MKRLESRWCDANYLLEADGLIAAFAKKEDMTPAQARSYLVHYALSRLDTGSIPLKERK